MLLGISDGLSTAARPKQKKQSWAVWYLWPSFVF